MHVLTGAKITATGDSSLRQESSIRNAWIYRANIQQLCACECVDLCMWLYVCMYVRTDVCVLNLTSVCVTAYFSFHIYPPFRGLATLFEKDGEKTNTEKEDR